MIFGGTDKRLQELEISVEKDSTGNQGRYLKVKGFEVGDREPDRNIEWLLRNLVLVLEKKNHDVQQLIVDIMNDKDSVVG